MPNKHNIKKTTRSHHHLTSLEIQAIFSAHAQGARVGDLATQYGVSRQSIYNAIQTITESNSNDATGDMNHEGMAPPAKQKRSRRIQPEVSQGIADLKRKYPTWGVAYIREHWMKAGHSPISITSIYHILRDAGLQTRELVEKDVYQRFEMTRPGQLWQMDIQGKIYLTGIGWVHGFGILDDFSRFCPGFHYFLDEVMSNGILLLNEAIEKFGVPDRVYTDNGSQFASRSERLNNFELFCAAYNIPITHTQPGKPSGKGKIERFFETVENQFITWVRATIKDLQDGSMYSLDQLNHDLEVYIQDDYHVHVHGITHETPVARFFMEPLRLPDPPVDVRKFLERAVSKPVNKCGEIFFKGNRIQVGLPGNSSVTVVETIETVRIEQGEVLIREINKKELSKDLPVKRQDGNTHHEDLPQIDALDAKEDEPGVTVPLSIEKANADLLTPDQELDNDSAHHRIAWKDGRFSWKKHTYHLGKIHACEEIFIQVEDNTLVVRNNEGFHVKSFEIKHPGTTTLPNPAVQKDMAEYGPDANGYYHRTICFSGHFRVLSDKYYLAKADAGKNILVQVVENTLHVFDDGGNLLKIIPIHTKSLP